MADLDLDQHVQIAMPDFSTISQASQIDPDVSSTLTDFLAYTEHLPSAVIRSMTLIGEQDRVASQMQQQVHEMLQMYSKLPALKETQNVPTPLELRKDISRTYDRMEKARRMAAAESLRMLDMVRKDQARLDVITHKLKVMPMPPSRDPTPEPVSSPQLRKVQPLSEKRASHRTGSAPRARSWKIMVPGEVLPPPNPDSPPPSDVSSDEESVRASPVPEVKRHRSVGRPRIHKLPTEKGEGSERKERKERKERDDKTPRPPRIREPGQPGTNVHSQVAGISTSNALLALVEPPSDALPGSDWFPWRRITEFELAKLRKRMKKNAIWLPSPAMRNRELKLLGRGQQAMEVAQKRAEDTGEAFLGQTGLASDWQDPTRRLVTMPESVEMEEMLGAEPEFNDEDDSFMNRGMRLNEAKKRKRERLLEEAAIQAQLSAEHNAEDKTMISFAPDTSDVKPAKASISSSTRKRKRDSTPLVVDETITLATSPDPLALSIKPKKIKLSLPSSIGAASRSSRSPLPRTSPSFLDTPDAGPRKAKIILKRSKAASAEPPSRRKSRRGSNVSLPGRAGSVDSRPPAAPARTTGGRRKRPAPGVITADEDGRAKVSVGTRKAAPRKGRKATEEEEVPEVVDPEEERYCVCQDVSWGTMVACDNEDECDKQWFHLECVELTDMPPRRWKWYCPDCRKKLKKGLTTNGIVKP